MSKDKTKMQPTLNNLEETMRRLNLNKEDVEHICGASLPNLSAKDEDAQLRVNERVQWLIEVSHQNRSLTVIEELIDLTEKEEAIDIIRKSLGTIHELTFGPAQVRMHLSNQLSLLGLESSLNEATSEIEEASES